MRARHLLRLVLTCAFAHSVFAADRCQQISDIVANMAAGKPKMAEVLRKNPEKGPLGELWRYFAFVDGEALDKLRVPEDEQQYIFKNRCDASLFQQG